MEVVKQIEENELTQLKEITGRLNQINSEIVALSIQKHNALHAHAITSNSLTEIKTELEKKYGRVIINMETGEYSEENPEQTTEQA
jgi:hypothetical protein